MPSMPDDVPPPSNNPFINFKRHVDSRIGAGLSVLTGTSSRTDSATTGASSTLESMDRAPNSPAPNPWADPSVTLRYWHTWAVLSPYSPYNLRHLPQPVPAGVSSNDARLFDFGDAFQDLLAVSSGRDLMDLRKQAEYKRSISSLFPFGDSPVQWVGHLSSKDLLHLPLPLHHQFDMSPQMIAAEALWSRASLDSAIIKAIEAQQQEFGNATSSQQQAPKWERLVENWIKKLDEDVTFNPATMLRQIEEMVKGFDEWTKLGEQQWQSHKERMLKVLDKDVTSNYPAIIAEVEKTMKTVHDLIEGSDRQIPPKSAKYLDQAEQEAPTDIDASLEKDEWAPAAEQNAQSRQEADSEPATEEDLFSALFDAFEGVEKAPTTKTSAEDTHKDEVRRSNVPVDVVKRDKDGSKTYITSTEHFDVYGGRHRKTEVRKVDANGNEISHETKYVFHPKSAVVAELRKSCEEREKEPRACSQDGKDDTSTTSSGKSTGWFWR